MENLAVPFAIIKISELANFLLVITVIEYNGILVLSGDFLHFTPKYTAINDTHSIPHVVVLLPLPDMIGWMNSGGKDENERSSAHCHLPMHHTRCTYRHKKEKKRRKKLTLQH